MASNPVPRHIVLTGPPGVGKTTLVRKICDILSGKGIDLQGFYTEELRSGGRRIGFDVVTLDGKRGCLARVKNEPSYPGQREYRIGQYSVDLSKFEDVALPTLHLQDCTDNKVVVIDEIGKMELFSNHFKLHVQRLLESAKCTIVATIPIKGPRPVPFVEQIRSRKDIQLFQITKENRNGLDNIIGKIIIESTEKQCSISK